MFTIRNWNVVAAWNRNGGSHGKSLNEPRGGDSNEHRDYLEDYLSEMQNENNEADDEANDE